jgi:hypothetical protein
MPSLASYAGDAGYEYQGDASYEYQEEEDDGDLLLPADEEPSPVSDAAPVRHAVLAPIGYATAPALAIQVPALPVPAAAPAGAPYEEHHAYSGLEGAGAGAAPGPGPGPDDSLLSQEEEVAGPAEERDKIDNFCQMLCCPEEDAIAFLEVGVIDLCDGIIIWFL